MKSQTQLLESLADSLAPKFEEISHTIFGMPELGLQEYRSSKYLAELMESYGFSVTYPYCDLATAFRAEYGTAGGPTIAFLAEYDALPGYGERGDTPAHACGHNWIAATTAGSAILLSLLQKQLGFAGKIVLFGTPAEETIGAKADLADAGAFADIDVAFQAHLGDRNDLTANIQALDSIEYRFKGKASHAAACPYEGVNALDAVQLMFAGIGALRQQLHPSFRVHGIVTEGGFATNIIPENAACEITTRCSKREDLEILTNKVINIAKGAALMTGAELSYRFFENPFDNFAFVPPLSTNCKKHLEEFGFSNIVDDGSSPVSGSTDMGNVSYACPTQYFEVAFPTTPPSHIHEAAILEHVDAPPAYEKLHAVVKGFAATALELFNNPPLVQEIRTWHRQNISKEKKA